MQFTYGAYGNLLKRLLSCGYAIAGYDDWKKYDRCVILRHDIDTDIEKAVQLAKKEYMIGVKSTYFVLVTSDFYNIFSKESANCLKQIIDYGHTIGLHFDETRYLEIVGDMEAIKGKIIEEAHLLGTVIGEPVKVVSMHRPSKEMLDTDLRIPGMINSYSHTFFKEFKYLSDSRRRWREPVEQIVDSQEYDRLHILTHAFWYHEKEKDIHDSIFGFINSGSRSRYRIMQKNLTDLESVMRPEEVI